MAARKSGSNGRTNGSGKPKPAEPERSNARRINLALQGGGAHGAFAWGVLDRILEHGGIEIEGIVGTSAGAMNAAVTAYGLAIGGNEGARATLRTFWKAISDAAKMGPLQATPLEKMFQKSPGSLEFSPAYIMLDFMSRMFSPYQLNPSNKNPLREVLAKVIDFEKIHETGRVKLFICASNVLTGRIRVFSQKEVCVDAVLASACLPFMFQAVEVDGQHYWDGGYMGNPPLYPLIYNCESRDILIVQLNPINIDHVPQTAQEILDRINTLSFNSSLMREMRAVHFVTKLIDEGFDDGGRLKRMLIHTVDGEGILNKLGVSSKLNADWDFLMYLFENGRKRGDDFLDQHYSKIGHESSTRIDEKFF
jgi:NTE family protein